MATLNSVCKTMRIASIPSSFPKAISSMSYSTEIKSEICIPKKIHRSPTDILNELSKTVNRDHTAPHYKYHDDPYLIPASNYAKRSFALAQESGRKAAKWILQEHSDLFQHKVADPFIEAYAPKQIITDESEVNLNSFTKAISNLTVTDACKIYEILMKNNVDLSREQLQSLLELVCFYNGDDKIDDDWIEERWFKQGVKDKSRQRKMWKDGGIAESIFLSIDPPDSKSFSALITGMAKYGQLEHAWKYYDEAKSKNIKLTVNVYNSLIQNSGYVREQHEARWALVKEFLTEMDSVGIQPNIGTLNAILEVLSNMHSHRNSRTFTLSTIAEFKLLGIEPSLASYYFLLKLFCRDRTRPSSILIDIMNVLDEKSIAIKDPMDTFFFVTAMEVCRGHLIDIDLANRVNELLLTGDNYNLIGDSYKESVYLRNYFSLKSECEPIEDFMKFYNLYVPNIYVPEPAVMEIILRSVDMNGASQYLPRLWSDMVLFDHISRENLVTLVIEILYRNTAEISDKVLADELATVAEDIFKRIDDLIEDSTNLKNAIVNWTGNMLGNLMSVLLQADKYEKACELFNKLDREQQKIVGVPDVRALGLFIDKAIEKRDPDNAILCLQYCYDGGYEGTEDFGDKVYKELKLSESQLSRLKTLVKLNFK